MESRVRELALFNLGIDSNRPALAGLRGHGVRLPSLKGRFPARLRTHAAGQLRKFDSTDRIAS